MRTFGREVVKINFGGVAAGTATFSISLVALLDASFNLIPIP